MKDTVIINGITFSFMADEKPANAIGVAGKSEMRKNKDGTYTEVNLDVENSLIKIINGTP